MSWMDSWSRPSKSQPTPPPFYLTHGDNVPYCHTCGRVIGTRRANTSKATTATSDSTLKEVKFCSDKCKRNKPRPDVAGSLEARIEDVLKALLTGQDPAPDHDDANGSSATAKKPPPRLKTKKGDPRIIVQLSELETAVFGDRRDPNKTYGRRKNRLPRFTPDEGEWKSVDMLDDPPSSPAPPAPVPGDHDHDTDTTASLTDDGPDHDSPGGGVKINPHIRAPQTASEVNFSVGGERGWAEKIVESEAMLAKRREGQKRAEERELVRAAARRAVVFGLLVPGATGGEVGKKGGRRKAREQEEGEGGGGNEGLVRRKCEALVNGAVVEPSFAKGDWSIRWRED